MMTTMMTIKEKNILLNLIAHDPCTKALWLSTISRISPICRAYGMCHCKETSRRMSTKNMISCFFDTFMLLTTWIFEYKCIDVVLLNPSISRSTSRSTGTMFNLWIIDRIVVPFRENSTASVNLPYENSKNCALSVIRSQRVNLTSMIKAPTSSKKHTTQTHK